MSEEKKCPKCGEVIPEGKDACEYMQCSITELEFKNEMGVEQCQALDLNKCLN